MVLRYGFEKSWGRAIQVTGVLFCIYGVVRQLSFPNVETLLTFPIAMGVACLFADKIIDEIQGVFRKDSED